MVRMVTCLGAGTPVESLRPEDFAKLRASYAATLGATSIGYQVGRVGKFFNWLWEAGAVAQPMRFGPDFKRPPAKVRRAERNAKPPRTLTADEIRSLLDTTGPKMRAMILLGVNCGYRNGDCMHLSLDHLDLDNADIRLPRPKTGTKRESVLWPETVDALREALAQRPRPKKPDAAKLVFVSVRGGTFDTPTNGSISKEMRKLIDRLGIHRDDVGFYALRHMFATVGRRAGDKEAVDYSMGHTPAENDMIRHYVEFVERERLQKVVDAVRFWLWPEKASGGVEGVRCSVVRAS